MSSLLETTVNDLIERVGRLEKAALTAVTPQPERVRPPMDLSKPYVYQAGRGELPVTDNQRARAAEIGVDVSSCPDRATASEVIRLKLLSQQQAAQQVAAVQALTHAEEDPFEAVVA